MTNLVVLLASGTCHSVDDAVLVLDIAQRQGDGDDGEDENDGEPEDDVEDDREVLVGEGGQVVRILKGFNNE